MKSENRSFFFRISVMLMFLLNITNTFASDSDNPVSTILSDAQDRGALRLYLFRDTITINDVLKYYNENKYLLKDKKLDHFITLAMETSQGRLHESFPDLLPIALKRGKSDNADPIALFNIGAMYLQGLAVQQNFEEAYKCFKMAAEQGYVDAQCTLGLMYLKGKGGQKSYEVAYGWFKRAAEKGHAVAQSQLGEMYLDGLWVQQSYENAFKYFKGAAEQGYDDAQFNLGVMYYDGLGIQQDYKEAYERFKKAAAKGHVAAQYNLGAMCCHGLGVKQSYEEAYECFKKAAAQGHIGAQYDLGLMYYKGIGGKQNYKGAYECFKKVAAQGHVDAQYNLGVMHYNGLGVQQSYEEAYECFKKAAAQGHIGAQYVLGLMYYKGIGVQQNDKDAFEYFMRAAKQGHVIAQCNLGVMYRDSLGVQQNLEEACRYFKLASEQGHVIAQFNLGVMYYHGLGVQQNDKDAFEYFMRAAKQGHDIAQSILAEMYLYGLGVQQSDERAAYWYGLASEISGDFNPYTFYHNTKKKMDLELDWKKVLFAREGNLILNREALEKTAEAQLSYGKLKELMPDYNTHLTLFETYIKRITDDPELNLEEVFEPSSRQYLRSLLQDGGSKDTEVVPPFNLRMHIIMDHLNKLDQQKLDNELYNLFLSFGYSIRNCTSGKSDSLNRFFKESEIPDKHKYIPVEQDYAEKHETNVFNFISSFMASTIEEFLGSDDCIRSLLNLKPQESILEGAHQSNYLRSTLGHHLGLPRCHVLDLNPNFTNIKLIKASKEEVLSGVLSVLTPSYFIEKLTNHITLLINEGRLQKHSFSFSDLERCLDDHSLFDLTYDEDDKEITLLKKEGAQKLLVRGRHLKELEDERLR